MAPTLPHPPAAAPPWPLRATIGFAWGQLRPHGGALAAAVAWRVLFRLLPVQIPLFTGALIDGLNGRPAAIWGFSLGGPGSFLVHEVGLALVLMALLTGLAAFTSARAASRLAKACVRQLQQKFVDAWQHASLDFHRRHGAADLAEATLSDTRGLGLLARSTVVEGAAAIARLLYPAVMLFVIDPWMALIPLSVLPVQALLTHTVQRRQARFTDSLRRLKSSLTRCTEDTLHGIETVQSLNAQSLFSQRIASRTEALEQENIASGVYSSLLTGLVWTLAALAVGASWWFGASRVVEGQLSPGDLLAFTGFVGYLAVPLRRFAELSSDTRRSLNRLAHVAPWLGAAEASRSLALRPLTFFGGEIAFRDLTFTAGGRPVLEHVNTCFPARESVWLRGPAGSGKSAVLHLLAGFVSPQQGDLLIDGQHLTACSVDSIRASIAFVPHHPVLFTGTIGENLRLGQPEADDSQLLWAARVSGFLPVLNSLPQGLETPVGDRGHRLSPGDAQLLAIARALLRQPRLLLLDHPSAWLTPSAELHLLQGLAALKPSLVVWIAAPQLDSTVGIDRIVDLDHGALRESPLRTVFRLAPLPLRRTMPHDSASHDSVPQDSSPGDPSL